jgi:DNA ligase (NAD+)
MAKKQTNLIENINSHTENGNINRNPKDQKENSQRQERIQELEEQIKHHRDLYYNKTPEISDAKYDHLEDELRGLDPQNPLFFKIGADSSDLFEKREHIMPMMSQDKASTPEEFRKWAKKRNYDTYIVQFKLDGVSIELQYKSGVFQCAVSRGDGKIGDDITQNVMKMKGFIPRLNSRFAGALRAEVVLFRDVFENKHNDKQNPRNAAAGIVRRKDGIGNQDLNLIYYDAYSTSSEVQFGNELDKIKWLKAEHLDTVKTKVVKSLEEVIEAREKVISKTRAELNYEIDGLVIKGKEIDLEDLKRARPESQIAFKFPAEEIDSILKEVEWSISGHNYTPVAIIEPVEIAGTTISRASLANPNLIEELGIKIGSKVIVSKRGDIIPKIESVISTPKDAFEIKIPQECEVCHSRLINEGTRLYCPNEECPKRAYHRILKWIRKLDVKHFSEKLMLSKLFETGKIQTIADLYDLNVSDLTRFEGVKEKSAKKALDNLFKIKEIPLERFIAGFDIENIGEKMVRKVVDAGYDTLEKIKCASLSDLQKIEGFAEITAETLKEGVEKMYPKMRNVLDKGKIEIQKPISGGNLEGLTFCFTGALKTMKRKEAQDLVIQHGGEPKSSVVKNLSYLVTNSTEQTAKYRKAKNQGTKIISEEEFLTLLE